MWNKNRLTELLNLDYPVIQAPMAGGPTTPALIAAVAESGGLGSIGAGYLTPEKLREEIIGTKELTDKPFSVNLFVPEFPDVDQETLKKSEKLLLPYRRELGLPDRIDIVSIQQSFEDQLNVILEEGIEIISFTFGIPSPEQIKKLKSENVKLIGTATNVNEAIELEKNGMDIIVAQGSEAGGHRGTFMGSFENSLVGTIALVPQVVDKVSVPVVAAGGIMDARGIVASFILGASGVQMGTVFLTCDESGANDLHKNSILKSNENDTVTTKVFSGKMARGIRNRFIDDLKQYEDELPPYPVQNSLTREIRQTAAKKNKPEYMSLWAGQGLRLAKNISVNELMENLSAGVIDILSNLNSSKL